MMKSKLIGAVFIIATIVACSSPKEDSFFEKLDLKDMAGNAITLDELEGKLVFINLWATYCKPCLKEMPSIDRAKTILEKEGYLFIAVSDEEQSKIQKFVDRFDYSFQFAQYELGIGGLGVYALPASYIVNDKGEMLYKHVGAKEWDDEENIQLFRSYLNDK
ncbi:TlpA disulfide reductase family protein [Roseivirga pacifica]|uniref:TlpA disulfide reductase family protein n=1 Tax=Roseivirga pacifica TaxID=1267423 RepID=UPI003BA84365